MKERKEISNTLTGPVFPMSAKVQKNNEDVFSGCALMRGKCTGSGKHGDATTAEADFVFAVSDGMGGAKAGEFASNIAVEKSPPPLPEGISHDCRWRGRVVAEVLTKLFRKSIARWCISGIP